MFLSIFNIQLNISVISSFNVAIINADLIWRAMFLYAKNINSVLFT